MEELNTVYKPIKELKPYKKNAKKHSKEQVEQIANSMEKEKEQFELLQKKWGSNIVRLDTSNKGRSKKNRKSIDYNPMIKIPIKGI